MCSRFLERRGKQRNISLSRVTAEVDGHNTTWSKMRSERNDFVCLDESVSTVYANDQWGLVMGVSNGG